MFKAICYRLGLVQIVKRGEEENKKDHAVQDYSSD